MPSERGALKCIIGILVLVVFIGFISVSTSSPIPAAGDGRQVESKKVTEKPNQNEDNDATHLFDFPECLLSSLIVFGGALLCAGAGVGGGAFNLVAYIIFLNLGPHQAVPLSKATILGVAIGSYFIMWRKRHPSADRPLIDYDTTLLMEPLTLAGTVIGVFFNVAFPEFLIVVGLVILLSITAYKTFQKGQTTYKKENAAKAAAPTTTTTITTTKAEVAPLVVNEGGDEEADGMSEGTSMGDLYIDTSISLREKIVNSEKGIPLMVVIGLFFTWGIFITAMFVVGSNKESLAGIPCGSVWYYLVLALAFIFLVIVTMVQATRLYFIHQRKEEAGYHFADGDIHWTGARPFLFPFLCVTAGWAAGFLGVGGGLVAGPILLQLGMQPQVATSTAGFMILFTASSTTIQYSLLGLIPWQYGLYYGGIAFIGAMLGQVALAELIKKTGRQSYAVFLLGVLEVVSMLAIGGLGIKDIIEEGFNADFRWIC